MKKNIIVLVFAMSLMFSVATAQEYVYVVKNNHLSAPNKLAKIDGSTMNIVDEIDLYRDFYSIAINHAGSRLWGTCKNSEYIVLIDIETFKILKTIDLGDIILDRPAGIACTSNNLAYVAYSNTGKIGIYNATTGDYIKTIKIGGTPMRIFISPDEKFAYVVNYQDHPEIIVLRLSDNRVMKNILFEGHAVQEGVFSPDGSIFYLANMDMNRIERIRTSDHTALIPYNTSVINPRSLGISPDGKYLFVGHYTGIDSKVRMMNISTWKAVDSVDIPYNARFIAVRDDGSRLYVSEHSGNELYAYDVSGASLTYNNHVSLGGDYVAMNLVIHGQPPSPPSPERRFLPFILPLLLESR
jgi:DNA-binding beta-propeller fold protein YncE